MEESSASVDRILDNDCDSALDHSWDHDLNLDRFQDRFHDNMNVTQNVSRSALLPLTAIQSHRPGYTMISASVDHLDGTPVEVEDDYSINNFLSMGLYYEMSTLEDDVFCPDILHSLPSTSDSVANHPSVPHLGKCPPEVCAASSVVVSQRSNAIHASGEYPISAFADSFF